MTNHGPSHGDIYHRPHAFAWITEDPDPQLSQLDVWDMPETPKQQHERYLMSEPRRETFVRKTSWTPGLFLLAMTGIAMMFGLVVLIAFAL
ncbi:MULTISPECIES: hypothetical protein [unclassified Cryobacterium]|uniref:hypothetical protein n=1 Tax=unclassified Cryobacterium TaxID=2649013 RepID=UPI00106DCD7C|nr:MULTISPECIES: hypothetical protein [unclassified Cryobacterium]TFB96557.1 hypothetical protein E3O39_10830 [Cryobacterium sp. MDB2-A-1]TFC12841.1 hypothetical protein E3O35_07990 [Cryobacterium sp. MDB2-A-2]